MGADLDVILISPRLGDLAQLPLALEPPGPQARTENIPGSSPTPELWTTSCRHFGPRIAPAALDVESGCGSKATFSTRIISSRYFQWCGRPYPSIPQTCAPGMGVNSAQQLPVGNWCFAQSELSGLSSVV